MDGSLLSRVIVFGLVAAFWAGFFSRFDGAPRWVKNLRGGKPFGCPLCMSFWASVILWVAFGIVLSIPFLEFVLGASASAMASVLLLALYDKLTEPLVIR